MKQFEYQKLIGFTNQQKEAFVILEKYGVNVNQQEALLEKLLKERNIKRYKINMKTPRIVKKLTITEDANGLIVTINKGFPDTQLIGMFRIYEVDLIQKTLKPRIKSKQQIDLEEGKIKGMGIIKYDRILSGNELKEILKKRKKPY